MENANSVERSNSRGAQASVVWPEETVDLSAQRLHSCVNCTHGHHEELQQEYLELSPPGGETEVGSFGSPLSSSPKYEQQEANKRSTEIGATSLNYSTSTA